jgi:hypothetical protein
VLQRLEARGVSLGQVRDGDGGRHEGKIGRLAKRLKVS